MRTHTISHNSSNPRIVEIIYHNDDSVYRGEVNNGNLRHGFGRYYDKNGQIIQAGEWIDDECIRIMNDEQIENEMRTT